MQTLEDIDAQIDALQKQRDQLVKAEREADLKTVMALCRKHGFFENDLGSALRKRNRRTSVSQNGSVTKNV